MSLVSKVLFGFRPDLLYFTRGEFVHLGRGNWRENAPIKPAPSITPVIYNIYHPLILHIFTITFNHIFAQPPVSRTVGKDWRPARIRPGHSCARRALRQEREAEAPQPNPSGSFLCAQGAEAGKGGGSPAKKLENPPNRPVWLFSFAFPLFLVSFWSLSGLFQVLFMAHPEIWEQKPCSHYGKTQENTK